jgi:hypothetical protein
MQDAKAKSLFFVRYRVFTIIAIGLVSIPVADIIGISVDYATILFITIYIMLGLGIWQISNDSSHGIHSKALICLTMFAGFSAIGEAFWMVCAKEVANTCHISEKLWLTALIPQIAFAILYIKPFLNSVSKKNMALGVLISLGVFIPSMFYLIQHQVITNDPDLFSVYFYTVFDTILIMFMTLGFSLFFRGRVNFSWSLLLFGILSLTIGDFAFLNAKINGSLFIDELENVFYVFGYVLLVLGLYYKTRNFRDSYHNQELLR